MIHKEVKWTSFWDERSQQALDQNCLYYKTRRALLCRELMCIVEKATNNAEASLTVSQKDEALLVRLSVPFGMQVKALTMQRSPCQCDFPLQDVRAASSSSR